MKASILTLIIFYLSIHTQAQDTTFVELRNGVKYEGKIEVETPFLKKSRIILNDTTVILLERVQRYQSKDGYFVRISYADGDGFAKLIEEGNIDLYIREQMTYSGGSWMPGPNGTSTYMPGGAGISSVQYFSKNGSRLQKASARNLKIALADNPTSMSYLNKRDGLTAVQVLGAIAGVAIAAATFSGEIDKESPDFTGLVIGGVVFTGSIWLPYFAKEDLVDKAIQEYNRVELPSN
ncbi:MAG: hypothetical protein ED557_11965 [Balneola sp.]|nr:MAG: hypothetical protein ED557_11965 [Balneola sp.]